MSQAGKSWREGLSSTQRGYGHAWRKAREGYLRSHPKCVMCEQLGRVRLAVVVDHIEAHNGDQDKFWDRSNWQSLCKTCHDAHKQRLERGRGAVGCGLDGVPVHAGHHWRVGWGGENV